MKYKVTYTTEGERIHDDGVWELLKIDKKIIVTKIEEYGVGVFSMHAVGYKTIVGTYQRMVKGEMRTDGQHPLRDHEDGTYTIYFKKAGTPYYFEPYNEPLAI